MAHCDYPFKLCGHLLSTHWNFLKKSSIVWKSHTNDVDIISPAPPLTPTWEEKSKDHGLLENLEHLKTGRKSKPLKENQSIAGKSECVSSQWKKKILKEHKEVIKGDYWHWQMWGHCGPLQEYFNRMVGIETFHVCVEKCLGIKKKRKSWKHWRNEDNTILTSCPPPHSFISINTICTIWLRADWKILAGWVKAWMSECILE